MSGMGNIMSAFDDMQNGSKADVRTGPNKFSQAKDAYLSMLGESKEQVEEAKQEELKESSNLSKRTAALQVIKETAETYEDVNEAFSKIMKIVDACK